MPDIGTWLIQHWDSAEHAVIEAAEHVVHGDHPYASQAPAAQPVNLKAAPAAQPPEEDMSLLDTIKNGVAEAEAKLEGLDEEALGILKSVMANPEAAVVMKDLGGLASIVGIPEGTIAGVAGGLKTVLSLYAQPQQPAPVPAA